MSIEQKEWCVYKHTSPSNKVYIGIAKDVKHRWRGKGNGYKGSNRIYYAIQKYGWDNFKHEILFDNLAREDACKKEIELISFYKSTDERYGYNLDSGGTCPRHSQETIEKLSKANLGHPVSDEVRLVLSECRSKKIICLDTMTEYKNGKEAAEKLNLCRTSVLKTANGKQKTCGGMKFAFVEDYNNGIIKEYHNKKPNHKRVLCVTTGEVFDNISDASHFKNISRRAISYCCNGKYKTSGGLEWKFVV